MENHEPIPGETASSGAQRHEASTHHLPTLTISLPSPETTIKNRKSAHQIIHAAFAVPAIINGGKAPSQERKIGSIAIRGHCRDFRRININRAAWMLPPSRIAEICHKHDVVELSVFGSVLRDDFGPESDVDFLAVFRQDDYGPWMAKLQHLERDLSALVGRDVDVVTKESVLQSENWISKEPHPHFSSGDLWIVIRDLSSTSSSLVEGCGDLLPVDRSTSCCRHRRVSYRSQCQHLCQTAYGTWSTSSLDLVLCRIAARIFLRFDN